MTRGSNLHRQILSSFPTWRGTVTSRDLARVTRSSSRRTQTRFWRTCWRTFLGFKELVLVCCDGFETSGLTIFVNKCRLNVFRSVYDDPHELEKYSDDNKELAWMFFVDGCAILQAVYMRSGNDDDDGKMFVKDDLLTFVYSDQFLLENQLPFRVLELLTSQRENGKKIMNAIQRFIDDTVINPGEDRVTDSSKRENLNLPGQNMKMCLM
ncbi:hypothetical protein CXB51_028101 [Gossypium anomalum]|uniref:Uncharacterized protein n=1 Tax=Gossypium anomalum TaxID=47600 RepID=A0A8J6CPB9_9ROSI|nr:hypothetical protein CXB51_028101 [Gossypium anomalum]